MSAGVRDILRWTLHWWDKPGVAAAYILSASVGIRPTSASVGIRPTSASVGIRPTSATTPLTE